MKFNEDYIIDVSSDYSPMRKNVWQKTEIEDICPRDIDKLMRKKAEKQGLRPFQRVELTEDEMKEKVTRDYKTLFKKGDEINLKKGINIFVGDNGCGKSTLLKIMSKHGMFPEKTIFVDLEKANPTISTPKPEHGITYSAQELVTQFMWSLESHGETREGVLMNILTLDFDFLILDEPEQGLSLKNQKKYFNKLKDLNVDIIVITHSKVFVELAEEIFDVETMQWINSVNYLQNINMT